MRKSARKSAPRRVMASSSGTRSRAEAAIELVRLEYERERLTQTINELHGRLEGLTGNLQAVDGRITWLTEIINPVKLQSSSPAPVRQIKTGGFR